MKCQNDSVIRLGRGAVRAVVCRALSWGVPALLGCLLCQAGEHPKVQKQHQDRQTSATLAPAGAAAAELAEQACSGTPELPGCFIRTDRGKMFIFLSVHSDSTGLKLHQSQSTEAEKNPPAVTSLGVPQEHSQLISLLTSSHPSQQTLDRLTTKHARAQRHQLSCSPRQQVQLLHHRRTLLMETLVVLLHSRFAGSPVGRRGGQHPGQTSVSTAAFCPHQPPVGNT